MSIGNDEWTPKRFAKMVVMVFVRLAMQCTMTVVSAIVFLLTLTTGVWWSILATAALVAAQIWLLHQGIEVATELWSKFIGIKRD